MQAVVCHDFNEAAIEDVPIPEPGDDEAVVAVDRVQLSVTECRLYRGMELAHVETIRDRLRDGSARLFGHEFCGVVDTVGTDVDTIEPGDRVYAPGKISCHACAYCEAGYHHFCENKEGIGYERPGALSEYAVFPAEPLSRLPDGVSDAEGAAMQPLASALLSVHDAGIETGDVVAVVGTGPMGYACGQLAAHLGASRVITTDIVPEKLELAADRGMIPVDARTEDPTERVRELAGGTGADVVFEAVGGEQDRIPEGTDPFAQAFQMVRRGGTIVQIGHILDQITLTPRAFRSKNVTWLNSRGGTVSIGPNTTTGELAPRLVADGVVSIEEYVTHELPGLERFEEAVELTLDESAGFGPAQMVVDTV